MNDRQILAAALRWHNSYTKRLTIGTENARRKKAERADYRDGYRSYFGPSSGETAPLVTAAKRVELAALRELAKVCAKVRGHQTQIDDACEVIDVDVKLLSTPGTVQKPLDA